MPQQFTVPALLKARLGHPLVVEETDNVGVQIPLGINPLGIGLQIQTTDAQRADPFSRLRIQPLRQLDSGAALSQFFEQLGGRLSQGRRQQLHHILGWSNPIWGISRKIEVARVGPEPKPDLIHRHQSTGSIDDRTALSQRCAGLCLEATRSGLQLTGLDQLQPSHPTDQPDETGAQDQKDNPQSSARDLGQGHDTGSRSFPGRRGCGPGHQ